MAWRKHWLFLVSLLLAVVQVGVEDCLLVESHPVTEECEVVGVVEIVDVVVVGVGVHAFLVAAPPQLTKGLATTGRRGLSVNIVVLGFILQATVEGEGTGAGSVDQVVLECVLTGGRVTVESAVAAMESPGVSDQVVVEPDVSEAVLGQVGSVISRLLALVTLRPGLQSTKVVGDASPVVVDVVVLHINHEVILSPVSPGEALRDDVHAAAAGPRDLVVVDPHVEAALVEDTEGAPLPGDADTVDVVVGHCDVLELFVPQTQQTMVTWATATR